MTTNVSATTLILALRRFFLRRGLPRLFISDNFKSFKAEDVKNFMRNNRISWKFILEKSPWWGGFYERLIKIVKSCLKKVIGNAYLNYEEVNTILVEIENSLNSRPLTYISDENYDEALTPYHLLHGRNINSGYVSISENEVAIVT